MYRIKKISRLFKSFSSLSKKNVRRNFRFIFGVSAILFSTALNAQIANYVNNGSFEDHHFHVIARPYHWGALDTLKFYAGLLTTPNTIPNSSYAHQWPHSGKSVIISGFYSYNINNNRGYPRNRLKTTLKAGYTYCATMYVNLSDQSTYGIDALGMYFGDSTLDTIKKCNDPITYLAPQVENPINTVLTDTMNWIRVTGTFVANGTEKYMLIGNFKSNTNTNSIVTNTTNLPTVFAEYLIDDVSVIEVDLPAYAGPDIAFIPGDSAYIGREPDFAIDPGCVWFKLPDMTPLDTTSGMWVKPAVTTTYVVRQRLDCSSEKWDTVVVHINPVGLERLAMLNAQLKIHPVPANEYFELSGADNELMNELKLATIYNSLGQFVKEEEFIFTENSYKFKVEDLMPGAYLLQLKSSSGGIVTKRFMVNR